MDNNQSFQQPFNKKQWLASSPQDNNKVRAVLFSIIAIYAVCAVLAALFIIKTYKGADIVQLKPLMFKYLMPFFILAASTRALWGFKTDCAFLCCVSRIKRNEINYKDYIKKYGAQLPDKRAQKDHEFFIGAVYSAENPAAKQNLIIRIVLAIVGEIIPDIFLVITLFNTVVNQVIWGGSIWKNIPWVWAAITIVLYIGFYIAKEVLESAYTKNFKIWWDGFYGAITKEEEEQSTAVNEEE